MAGDPEIAPRTEMQASREAGVPGEHSPAMARIWLRTFLFIDGNGREPGELRLQPRERFLRAGALL